MAKAKTDLNTKSVKDLLKNLSDEQKKLLDIKISLAQGKIKDSHSRRKVRKEIARIKTAIKEKEIAG